MNIYAPNAKQDKFYAKLYQKMLEEEEIDTILVGDFNAVFGKMLGRKSSRKKGRSRILPRPFLEMVEELNMID